MFIDVYCLPWTDKVPIAITQEGPLKSGWKEFKFAVAVDIQKKINQVFIFTDREWPKQYSDVEIDVACKIGGKVAKEFTLTQNERCFLWDETDVLQEAASIDFTAEFRGSSLIVPDSPKFTKINKPEGQQMQEMNEKSPEVTFPVSSSPLNVKGKRKLDKENTQTTPKVKTRRQQVTMRAATSASKSPLIKTKQISSSDKSPLTKSRLISSSSEKYPSNQTSQSSTSDPSSADCNEAISSKIAQFVNLSARDDNGIYYLLQTAPKPSSRWGHTMCMVDDNKAILIGGQGDKQFCRDSVWMMNPEMRTWKSSELTTDASKPELRVGHTATYDPTMRCIYIFGGSKKSKWFHDVHMFDLDEQKWTLVKANGKAPTRAYHSATLYRHELWMFGGVYPRPTPQPDASDNEIHIFSPLMEGWYKPIVTGEKPLVRSGHTATLMNDCLVVFGGWDFPYCYDGIHILDLTTVDWSTPTVNGTPPKPRSWHSSSALSNNRIFIHGGYDGDDALQDAFIFNLDTHTWNELALSNSPPARAGHACIRLMSKYEKEDEDEIIIFGGGDNDGSYFDDMLSIYIPHHPVFV